MSERSVYKRSEIALFAVAGVLFAGLFGVAGQYFGTKMVEPSPGTRQMADAMHVEKPLPYSAAFSKTSLLAVPPRIEPVETFVRAAPVVSPDKQDFLRQASLLPKPDETERLDRLSLTPPVWKLEKSWELGQKERTRVLANRDNRMAEHTCLAKAIYFEARSESELGQLAVANVVLNRVKERSYPSSICGVVYQGAKRRNSCQFSFACDGLSDEPRNGSAWRRSKEIASRAMNGASGVKVISTATHYHADYVKPKWSGAMKRLIKIGRHVFYHGS